jgi:hypothetical protein
MRIKKGIKKKDLFRFLLAKLLYEKEEGLHLDEFLVMWELYLQLLEVNSKDPSFHEKYGDFFEKSLYLFRLLGESREFPIRIEEDDSAQYLERIREVLEPMLPTRSAYFGLKGQKSLKSCFSLDFANDLIQRKLPEPRVIGVGYRDKGSRRDLAVDGSPDWKEVFFANTELLIREVEEYTKTPRESSDFNWDYVLNSKLPWSEAQEEEDSILDPEE